MSQHNKTYTLIPILGVLLALLFTGCEELITTNAMNTNDTINVVDTVYQETLCGTIFRNDHSGYRVIEFASVIFVLENDSVSTSVGGDGRFCLSLPIHRSDSIEILIHISSPFVESLDTTIIMFSTPNHTDIQYYEFFVRGYNYLIPFSLGSVWNYEVSSFFGDYYNTTLSGVETWEVIEINQRMDTARVQVSFEGIKEWSPGDTPPLEIDTTTHFLFVLSQGHFFVIDDEPGNQNTVMDLYVSTQCYEISGTPFIYDSFAVDSLSWDCGTRGNPSCSYCYERQTWSISRNQGFTTYYHNAGSYDWSESVRYTLLEFTL